MGAYSNCGVGGTPGRSGVTLIQIKCSKCTKRTRLELAIESTGGLEQELEIYKNALAKLPTEDKQAKRRRTASTDGNGIRDWVKIPAGTTKVKPLPPMSAGTNTIVPTTAARSEEMTGLTTQPSPPTAFCNLPLAGRHLDAGLGNQTSDCHVLKSEVTGVATQKKMAEANKAIETEMEFLNSKLYELYSIVNNNIINNNNNIIMHTNGSHAGEEHNRMYHDQRMRQANHTES